MSYVRVQGSTSHICTKAELEFKIERTKVVKFITLGWQTVRM